MIDPTGPVAPQTPFVDATGRITREWYAFLVALKRRVQTVVQPAYPMGGLGEDIPEDGLLGPPGIQGPQGPQGYQGIRGDDAEESEPYFYVVQL